MCKFWLRLRLFFLLRFCSFNRNYHVMSINSVICFCLFFIFQLRRFIVKTMINTEFDYVCKFLNINDIKWGYGLSFILFRNIFLDIVFQMREEVLIHLVISEVEDILYWIFHLLDIESINRFELYAFYIELVIDLLLYILSISLKINEKTFLRLLDLLHKSINLFAIKIFYNNIKTDSPLATAILSPARCYWASSAFPSSADINLLYRSLFFLEISDSHLSSLLFFNFLSCSHFASTIHRDSSNQPWI